MNGLLKDLEAVAGLDERATPGIIELHTSCSWRRIMAPRGRGFLVPGIDPDKHPNMDSIENAQFVVALVNWFRTHHAEIAGAVKDARRLDWLNAFHGIDNECSLSVHHKDGGFLIDDLREAIDAAMHNSAREDGE